MQTIVRPFRPLAVRGIQIPVAASIVSTQLRDVYVTGGTALRLVNYGSTAVSLSFTNGADAGLTAINGHILLPNTVETFFFADDVTHVNAISTAGTTLYISFGEGA